MSGNIDFGRGIEDRYGCAVIVTGSDSDKPHVDRIAESLELYNIPYDVYSVHEQLRVPTDFFVEWLNGIESPLVVVAVAGGTDALSGFLSFNLVHPVISCPPDGFNVSCLRNPIGSSNAYIQRPENVGRYITQMFSHINPFYREIIKKSIEEKEEESRLADIELREHYRGKKEDDE